ncbi:MAG: peptidoglycan-binding protein [Ferruginibacter sp.]
MAQQGGWGIITGSAKQTKKGGSSPIAGQVKKRLQMKGIIPAGDTTAMVNDSLSNAIRSYQLTHGLKPTGIINDSLIASLNVPVEKHYRGTGICYGNGQ